MSSNYFKQAKDKAARAQAIAAENKKKKEEEERKKREEQKANQKRAAQPSSSKKALSKPSADTYNFDGNLKKYSGEQNISTQNVSSVKLNVPRRKETVIQNKPILSGGFNSILEKEDFKLYSKYNPKITDRRYLAVNGNVKPLISSFASGRGDDDSRYVDNLTDTERSIYNYYFNKGQKKKSNDYLKSIDSAVNKRVAEKTAENSAKFANEHPVASVAFNIALSPQNKMGSAITYAKQKLNPGEEIDINAKEFMANNIRSNIMETVLKDKTPGQQFLINTAASIGDNIMTLPLGNIGAPVFVGLGAATDAIVDAKKRGASDKQAMAYGFGVGLIETLMEKVPIDNLFKIAGMPKSSAKKYILEAAKQIGIEGTEEFLTEIADNVADSLIMQDKSNLNIRAKEYEDNGYNTETAKYMAFKDMYVTNPTLAFAGGAASGGVFGAAGAVTSAVSNKKTNQKASPVSTEQEYTTVEKTVKKPVSTEFEENNNGGKMIDNLVKKHLSNTYSPDFAEFEAKERQRFNEATGVKAATAVFKPAQKLNVQQKNMVEDCKKLGISVTFIEGTREQTRGTDFNGAYHNGNIYINQSCENPYNVVLGHEVLHRIKDSDSKAYTQLCDIVNSALGENNDFSMLDEYDREEALADVMGDMIADPAKYREVFRQNQNLFQRLLGYIRDMISRLTGKTNGSFENVSKLTTSLKDVEGKLTEIYKESVGKTGEYVSNDARYSILKNSKGKYVKADRQVISGDDPKIWAKQVKDYIDNNIRHGKDINVLTEDGDVLTITRDTSGKAMFRNDVRTGNGQRRKMTDKEYAVKLRAETHVDELAQISKNMHRDSEDYKNHGKMAENGFEYRTVYFEDVDGTYYKLTLSVGKGNKIKTVYNVGQLFKATKPDNSKKIRHSLRAQRPSDADSAARMSESDNSISQNDTVVNSNYMQNNEKNSQNGENTENLTPLQKAQRAKNKTELSKTGWNLTDDGKYALALYESNVIPNRQWLFKQDFKLTDVYKGKNVLEAYPFLNDTNVVFDNNIKDGGSGYYDAETNTIHLNKNNTGLVNSDLLLSRIEEAVINYEQTAARKAKTLDNAKEYPRYYDVNKVDKEFINYVDENLMNFIEYAKEKPGDSKKRFKLSNVNKRLAEDIQNLTKIDVSSYDNTIKANTITHILKDHGKNGRTDHSMANIDDIARIDYVIKNYDSIELIPERSKEFINSDKSNSLMVRISKKIDGTYYVAEAVPDTKAKSLNVVSAYIQKKKSQQPTADENKPLRNVQNASSDNDFFSDSISQNDTVVNSDDINEKHTGNTNDTRSDEEKHLTPDFNRQEVKITKDVDSEGQPIYKHDVDTLNIKQLRENPDYKGFIAQAINYKDKSGTNQTAHRTFKSAFGKQYETFRNLVYGNIDKTKMQYNYIMEFWTNGLKENVVDKGITKNSKLSKLVMQYGEGEITLDELKKQAPEKWQDIVEADKWFRTAYNSLIDGINESRAKTYPNVEKIIKNYEDSLAKINSEIDLLEMGEFETVLSQKKNRTYSRVNELQTVKDNIAKNALKTIADIDNDIKATQDNMKLKKNKGTAVYFNLQKRVETLLARKAKIEELYKSAVSSNDKRISEILCKYSSVDEMKSADISAKLEELKNKRDMIEEKLDDESLWRGKRIPKRKDYYRHFTEMTLAGGIKNLFGKPANIATDLVGVSEFTKPKTKYTSIAQKRQGDGTKYDAVGGFIDYLPQAAYAMTIDHNVDLIRGVRDDLAHATKDTRNMNRTLQRLDFLANEFAGKTVSQVDRLIQDKIGRRAFRNINKIVGWRKAAVIVANVRSAVAQIGNLPNVMTAVENKKYLLDSLTFPLKNNLQNDSSFLKERFSDYSSQFDTGIFKYPKKFTDFMLSFGDEVVARYGWNAAYMEGFDKGVDNPVRYADDIIRSAVGGRGIGEKSLLQQSKIMTTLMPFSLETSNNLQFQIDMAKRTGNAVKSKNGKELLKSVGAFIMLYFSNAILEEALEQLTGNGMGLFNPFGIVYDNVKNDELSEKDKAIKSIEEIPGNFLGSTVMGQKFVELYPEKGMNFFGKYQTPERSALFGDENPTKYGTSNLISSGLKEPLTAFIPGGSQLQKTVKGVMTVNNGVATNSKGNVLYAVDKNAANYAKAALFGKSSLSAARQYYDTDGKPFSDKETEEYLSRVQNGETNLKVYLDINDRRKAKNAAERLNPFIGKSAQTGGEGIYKELGRLNSSGIDVSFEVPENEVEYNGETHKLSAVNYSRFVREAAQTAEKEVKSLMSTPYYCKCTDEDRQELIRDVYSYSKAAAKANVSNYELSSEYKKIKLAADEGISAGEFISFKKQLGKNKGVENVMKLSNQYGYGSGKTNNMINLITLSADEYKRISDAGGFKDSYLTYRIYNEAKKAGVECKTCFVPVAEKDFSYTDKTAKIKYKATLSEKQMKELQKVYIVYYEKAIEQLKTMNFSSKEDLYKKTQKLRSSAMKAAKRDYCYYLLKHK